MEASSWIVDFPTMWVAVEWIERHCVIPDGFHAGQPFLLEPPGLPAPTLPNEVTGWQLWYIVNHYRVKPDVRWDPEWPVLGPAFHYRRSQIVMPQKAGKAPLTAAHICLEGVGPALFAGWARGDEAWVCADHDCACGWVYEYAAGEPMGMEWPTPLIQITATSEDQTDNVYDALRPMIELGPLHEVIPRTGESFIRLPRRGRIDVVTSKATSRLGQRVTFAPQDETGLYTDQNGMKKVADTQRRGAAGMGGRVAETTNAWDPNEHSTAQDTAESEEEDIFRIHPLPPEDLDYESPEDRHRIHVILYRGSPWVPVESIDAEASELVAKDPAQAERFFGNRLVAGGGSAFNAERWRANARPMFVPPAGERITIGVDGARFRDALAIVATHVRSGFQWPLLILERPEGATDLYEHDFELADRVMLSAFDEFDVWRVYIDPQYIEILVDRWVGRWGDKRIVEWLTYRQRQMAMALRAYREAMGPDPLFVVAALIQAAGGVVEIPEDHITSQVTNDGDETMARHIENASKRYISAKDEEGNKLWLIEKPEEGRKIDASMAGSLSWEARGDAIAADAITVEEEVWLGA